MSDTCSCGVESVRTALQQAVAERREWRIRALRAEAERDNWRTDAQADRDMSKLWKQRALKAEAQLAERWEDGFRKGRASIKDEQ